MQLVGMGGLAAAAIVLMLAPDASAASRCDRAPAGLGRFQLAAEATPAPDVVFFDEVGGERRLSDFRGAGIIANFWATWCAPCVKEMPALDRLVATVAERRFQVVALSADREGGPIVRKFYDTNGLKNLPVAIDRRGAVARSLGVAGLPTTVLFDSAGREIGRVVGVVEWDAPEVVTFLSRCLAPAG